MKTCRAPGIKCCQTVNVQSGGGKEESWTTISTTIATTLRIARTIRARTVRARTTRIRITRRTRRITARTRTTRTTTTKFLAIGTPGRKSPRRPYLHISPKIVYWKYFMKRERRPVAA